MNYLDMLYRLAVALWAGGNAIFTLLLTPILFKTESRDTAARIDPRGLQAMDTTPSIQNFATSSPESKRQILSGALRFLIRSEGRLLALS